MSEIAAPDRSPRRFLRLETLFAIVAAGFFVWWITSQGMPSFPTSAKSLSLIALAIAAYAVATLLRGWRWHRILWRTGVEHARGDAYALVVVGYMGNTILPARGGELLRIVLMSRKSNVSAKPVLGSVIAERVLDALSLVFLFATAVLLNVRAASVDDYWAWIALGAVGLGALALGAYFWLRRLGRLQGMSTRLKPFTAAMKDMLSLAGFGLLLLSLGVWLIEGLIFWLVAESIEIDVTLLDGVALVVLASFFALIPAAPGYVGTYDAAIALGMRALDVSRSAAVTFVLLVRFVIYVPITVAGLLIMVTRYGGLRELRRENLRRDRELIREAEADTQVAT